MINSLGRASFAAGLHRSQALGRSARPVSFLFKSNFPPEPLPERLYSAKIPRALWLVGFSGRLERSLSPHNFPSRLITLSLLAIHPNKLRSLLDRAVSLRERPRRFLCR